MTISRKEQAACKTHHELVALHQRKNPLAGPRTSIAYANFVMKGRANRKPKLKVIKRHWQDID